VLRHSRLASRAGAFSIYHAALPQHMTVSLRLTVKPLQEIQEVPPPPREILPTTVLAPQFVALTEEKAGLLRKVPFTGTFALEIAETKGEKAILLTYKPLSLIYVSLSLTYIVAL
jgi:hypothetical protein